MRGNKKLRAYIPEALEGFGKSLLMVRQPRNTKIKLGQVQLELDGLQKAIQTLPKADREQIEKFWGLRGGPNHSKKLVNHDLKDIAYREMRDKAISSLRKLLTLDYAIIYDETVNMRINLMAKKINKNGLEISDTECIKYLMAFFVYAENGPKLSFEEDPMSIDTGLNENFLFDEYEVLNQMSQELSEFPDNSINLRLLISLFEMIDFKDMLIIKKSVGIEIPMETIPEDFVLEDVEIARSVCSIRKLKERVFPYGAWEIVTALILGEVDKKICLDNFIKELDLIRRDWSKVAEYKVGERKLKTNSKLRVLSVYNIGGLEFTDIYEVMFLYLERNLIAPEL